MENKTIQNDQNQKYQFNNIYNDDCVIGMKELDSDSIDIIICDPPYNIGKNFGNNSDKQEFNDYIKWCQQWVEQCVRILKPTGTMYIYGFSETLALIYSKIYEKINIRWLVWHYTNKVVPRLNFWQRTHESILCCYKTKNYIFNKDDIREPYTENFLKNSAGKQRTNTIGRFQNKNKEIQTTYNAHKNGALPRDVIKISSLAGGAGKKEGNFHPTQKPLELCLKLLKASLNKQGITNVLVPFAGSGSECLAAKQLSLQYIGFELNEQYIQIANERINNFIKTQK